jgi:hypothetical protein
MAVRSTHSAHSRARLFRDTIVNYMRED